MKPKAIFLMALLFIALISLTVVCADENTTQTLSEDNTQTVVCADENTTQTLSEDNSASEDVDLEVKIAELEVGETVDVSWRVTIENIEGVSKNTKVLNGVPDFVKIVAYSAEVGTFDSATNVWTVGELTPNTIRTIQFYGIFNKHLSSYSSSFQITATATTDNHDIDLSNNFETHDFKKVSPVSSHSGNRIHFDLGSFLPTFKYNSYRAPAKKVTAKTVKKTTAKKTTKKKAKKKAKKKKTKKRK